MRTAGLTMEQHLPIQGQALAAYVASGGHRNIPAPLPTSGSI